MDPRSTGHHRLRHCLPAERVEGQPDSCSAIEFIVHRVLDLVLGETDGVEVPCGNDGNAERLNQYSLAGLRPKNSVGDIAEHSEASAGRTCRVSLE